MKAKPNLRTPVKLLVEILAKPKAQFQVSFLVYRVIGPNQKQFVLPDIGLRAIQGHSVRDDLGPGYLMVAQERLNLANEENFPHFAFTDQIHPL